MEGGGDSVVRTISVSLSVEDSQFVIFAYFNSQSGSFGGQVDRSRLRWMNSSQIQSQHSVDKDPKIIISREGEDFVSLIGEGGFQFRGKVEVMAEGVVSIAFVIDGEESTAGIVDVNSRSRGGFVQGDDLLDMLVHVSGITIPLGEISGANRI